MLQSTTSPGAHLTWQDFPSFPSRGFLLVMVQLYHTLSLLQPLDNVQDSVLVRGQTYKQPWKHKS